MRRKQAANAAKHATESYGPGFRVRARRISGRCTIVVQKLVNGHAADEVLVGDATTWRGAARQAESGFMRV